MRFSKTKLKGTIRFWWYSVKDKKYKTGQPPIDSWEEMKMEENYLPAEYKQTLYEKMFLSKVRIHISNTIF